MKWPHVPHTNERKSTPDDSGPIRASIMRDMHLGQRGCSLEVRLFGSGRISVMVHPCVTGGSTTLSVTDKSRCAAR